MGSIAVSMSRSGEGHVIEVLNDCGLVGAGRWCDSGARLTFRTRVDVGAKHLISEHLNGFARTLRQYTLLGRSLIGQVRLEVLNGNLVVPDCRQMCK